ncbi:MAG: thiamine-phosphate kinase, partial [Porphyromonas sp.]|nr:thiamine-phosphate kinase [Porphyromonas sp.]
MQISDLGEVELLQRVTTPFQHHIQQSSIVGIGDDAALLDLAAGAQLLTSTELLMEGIHFDLVYFPLKYLGFKSVTSAVSDIIACGGTPRQLLLGLGLSQRFQVEDVETFMQGVHEALTLYQMDLIGADMTSSLTGFTISATAIGTVGKDQMIQRKSAEVNNLICLTGDIGAAYMGLQLLLREKVAYDGSEDFEPQFAGREYILQRQLHPIARFDILSELEKGGIRPTAMIDVTDGLASDLLQLCRASGVGCRIFEERLPIDYQTHAMAS